MLWNIEKTVEKSAGEKNVTLSFGKFQCCVNVMAVNAPIKEVQKV